jgi:hypothetical protein
MTSRTVSRHGLNVWEGKREEGERGGRELFYLTTLPVLYGGAGCWGTALQAGRSRFRFPMVSFEFFIDIILGSTEMNTRNISWGGGGGKGGRCVGLTTLPPSCADCLEIWEPQPPGNLRVCQACNGIALPYQFCIFYSVDCRWTK